MAEPDIEAQDLESPTSLPVGPGPDLSCKSCSHWTPQPGLRLDDKNRGLCSRQVHDNSPILAVATGTRAWITTSESFFCSEYWPAVHIDPSNN